MQASCGKETCSQNDAGAVFTSQYIYATFCHQKYRSTLGSMITTLRSPRTAYSLYKSNADSAQDQDTTAFVSFRTHLNSLNVSHFFPCATHHGHVPIGKGICFSLPQSPFLFSAAFTRRTRSTRVMPTEDQDNGAFVSFHMIIPLIYFFLVPTLTSFLFF